MSVPAKSHPISTRRKAVCWATVLMMLSFNPFPAQAQPLVSVNVTGITTIAEGAINALPINRRLEQLLITTPGDYSDFFHHKLGMSPPTTPAVDFDHEDVLAVTGGSLPFGSLESIEEVEIATTGFTAGWGFVHVQSIVGSGGPTLPMVNPYSVVKLSKGALSYSFVNEFSPKTGTLPWNSITYTTGGGIAPFFETVTADIGGHLVVNRSTGPAGGTIPGGTTYTGTLSPSELANLDFAILNANPSTLPATVPGRSMLTVLPSETISSIIGSNTYSTFIEQAGSYKGCLQLKLLVDALRGPTERIVRDTQLTGQPFRGLVTFHDNVLKVGPSLISPLDPFHDLIAVAIGRNLTFDAFNPSAPSVLDVHVTLNANTPLLSFPSAGAGVLATLPAYTRVRISNFTLFDKYVEAFTDDGEQRGYVPRQDLPLRIRF